MPRIALTLAAALLAVARVDAQVTTVDEGSFAIARNGSVVGREQFRIVSTPGNDGVVYLANATVSYDDRRILPALRTDANGLPTAYQVEVKVGPEVQERLKAQMGAGRMSAQLRTPQGESVKEYIVTDDALIVDDDIFHQYYFLTRRAPAERQAVVVPRRNAQVTLTLVNQGPEQLTVGGRRLDATRFVLSDDAGARRTIWADLDGRVLKVELPDRGIVALRDDPPR